MAWNRSVESEKKQAGGGLTLHKLALGVVGLLAVASVGVWLACGRSAAPAVQESAASGKSANRLERHQKNPLQTAEQAVRNKMPKRLPKRDRKAQKKRKGVVEMFAHLSGDDRKNAEAVQAALDADDLKATVEAAKKSLASTNAEVRLNAVEALGWFGAEALPELTGCMADADDDVREAAGNQWELAVQEVESAEDRVNLTVAALGTLTDEDQLRSLGGLLSCAATESLGDAEDEDSASEKRIHVVQALVDIIEGGGKAVNVDAAKEAYNDITGNEWKGFDEAERYLADPDNYEPPE